ncbi:potassium channel family protein [Sulfuracidifex metallicus]
MAPYSIFRKVFPQVVLLGVAVYVNAFVFMTFQHLDLLSAIYAGVNVVTTVGLYAPPLSQMPSTEKVILILTIIFAVGLYTSIIQSLVSTVVRRDSWADARARWRGSHMRQHTVVIGEGEAVKGAVRRLERYGVDYVVLTREKGDLHGDKVIVGDPKDEKNLISAGIMEAKNAIISMENDMDSLLVTLKVQKLNPPLQVTCIVRNSSMIDEFKTAGADMVIPAEDILGRITASAALSNNVSGLIFSGRVRDDIMIGFFSVNKETKVGDLPQGIVPLAIVRDGGSLDPYFAKDTVVKPGENLVVIGNPSLFKKVKDLLG